MKIRHFLFLLPFLLIASCSQSEITDTEAKGEKDLCFNILNYEQINLDSLTRATEVTALNHLVMGVYDATTMQLVQPATIQHKEDADYGRFSIRLPYGKYYIVFLGHMSSYDVQMDDIQRITWGNQSVTNTFLHCLTLEVSEQTNVEQNIILKRAVGGFTLRIQGEAPKALSQFRFQMQGGCYSLNAITGLGNAADERDYTMKYNNHVGKEEYDVNFFAFLPQESCTATITVQAQDKEGNTLRERTFTNVPMKLNQLTRYTGDFFAPDAAASEFSLALENDVWDEQDYNF